jgi:uncharacterized iron-regulated protein
MNQPNHLPARRAALTEMGAWGALGVLGALGALSMAGCAAPGGVARLPEAPVPPLDAAARRARFVLLGEVHDNAEHHRLRARWLSDLLRDGRPTTVLFEQMERDRDEAVRQAVALRPWDADAVARAGGLDFEAWGWPLHQPLFVAALTARHARLAGANLPTAAVRAVVRDRRVPADLQALIDTPAWTAALQDRVEQDMNEGHCGILPRAQWAPMALAQRARDAAMAQAMLAVPAGARAVLIAGNGHVRHDVGVPFYLRAAGVPVADIAAVGLLEGPAQAGDAAPPYDRVQFTAAAEREDPCVAFRAQMK